MGYLEEDYIGTPQYERALHLLCKTGRIEIFDLLSCKIEDYISKFDSKFLILLSYLGQLR